ncbi:nucleotidyltransferase domain-containing protein [Cellulomonas sp. IC4_254]|uniref:nucleotidyltransferase domain-containing protein n=1 Tax=Cellulomonas sp. IC4_254 TaxID=2714040 RepID=UPI0014204C69|nr:nucleotidyltransferase domain-containing protein [Cellulomonas sp. IC4_254]
MLAERSSHAVLYRANREHLAWPAIESAVRFATRALDALRDRLVATLVQHLGDDRAGRTTVALYGSVARGTADRRSDVDLVVLTPDDVGPDEVESLVLSVTAGVERWTGNACSVYELSTDRLAELVRAADPMVRSWLEEATTISGPDLTGLLHTHGA